VSEKMSVRKRIKSSLSGEIVREPVFAVYDWFVNNRTNVDWHLLFQQGLGQINHVPITEFIYPNLKIIRRIKRTSNNQIQKEVRWITEKGELYEKYLGEWCIEHLIKEPYDYLILCSAFSDVNIKPTLRHFKKSEEELGDNGLTIGVPTLNRTPFQRIQIDFAGQERFLFDLAEKRPELLSLLEVLNDLIYREFEIISNLPVSYLKLWENLSIELIGPYIYRQYLLPVYKKISDILLRSGQNLSVHYDGKLRIIADDIKSLSFDIDSLTPPPEGDMEISLARNYWPEKFLWLHPSLTWYTLPEKQLVYRIKQMCNEADNRKYCLLISEEVPDNWAITIPLILKTLSNID